MTQSPENRPAPQSAGRPPANMNRPSSEAHDSHSSEYVTLYLGDQMFGLPIDQVHDVFIASQIACVPLAPREIVGLLNLRGRVVTALSLRARLGMRELDKAPVSGGEAGDEPAARDMAIGIEHHGEAYALMVDRIGEVMRLKSETFESNPIHLDPAWIGLSTGVHRLDGQLLVILDVNAVLDFDAVMAA
jgi:purine-binding chemotaxis protein CheW